MILLFGSSRIDNSNPYCQKDVSGCLGSGRRSEFGDVDVLGCGGCGCGCGGCTSKDVHLSKLNLTTLLKQVHLRGNGKGGGRDGWGDWVTSTEGGT